MNVLIDSHIWIWWLNGQDELTSKNRLHLDGLAKRGTPPFLSAISLWEAQMLFRKGRLTLNMDFARWITQASDPQVVRVLPLDTAVILALDRLPDSFHGDPADRIIVATAKAHSLPLMTEDKRICRSRFVQTV